MSSKEENGGGYGWDAARPEDCPSLPLGEAVVLALEGQPLLTRLEFVRNMLAVSGGEKLSIPQDSVLVVAADVLDAAIEILATYPKVAMARCEADPIPVRPRRKKNEANPQAVKNH